MYDVYNVMRQIFCLLFGYVFGFDVLFREHVVRELGYSMMSLSHSSPLSRALAVIHSVVVSSFFVLPAA